MTAIAPYIRPTTAASLCMDPHMSILAFNTSDWKGPIENCRISTLYNWTYCYNVEDNTLEALNATLDRFTSTDMKTWKAQ